MSEPRNTLQAYQTKRNAAEQVLRGSFVAYVRVSQSGRKGPVGYLIYATDGNLDMYSNDNFALFYVTPPGPHAKDVHMLVTAVQQEMRRRYDEADFHSTVAVTALSGYARFVLEDWHEPQALMVCALFLDCAGKVRSLDYTGESTVVNVQGAGTKVILAGCYDGAVRKAVRTLLGTVLKGKPTEARLKRMLTELKGITGASRVSYLPVGF